MGIIEEKINKKKSENRDSKANSRSERIIYMQLNYKYNEFVWILDDESYFTLTHSEINGNDNFYSSDVELVANEIEFKIKDIFEEIVCLCYNIPLWHLKTKYNAIWDRH